MGAVRPSIPTGKFVILNRINTKGETVIHLRYFLGSYVKRSTGTVEGVAVERQIVVYLPRFQYLRANMNRAMTELEAIKARHAVRKYTDKPIEKFYEADGEVPGWFKAGMEAALLAPTAMNQQKFKFTLKEGNKVKAEPTFSLAGKTYLNYDLGIVKYHFEVAAGKENFTWL